MILFASVKSVVCFRKTVSLPCLGISAVPAGDFHRRDTEKNLVSRELVR